MKHYNNIARQAGMTLIELTVVLLILVGLAGLLIPYVGSFVQKTADTTSASNMTGLNNAMMRFTTEKNRLPHHMQALINNGPQTAGTGSCSAALADEVYCGLNNPSLFTATTAYVTTDIQTKSLSSSKLEMFVKANPDAINKTFDSNKGMFYLPDSATGTTNGVFSAVAGADFTTTGMATDIEQHLAYALGGAGMDYNSGCYEYLAFGMGNTIEMNGTTMTSTPVAAPADATYGPTQRYAYFIGILQVDKADSGTGTRGETCSEVTEKAKFLGTVMNVQASVNPRLIGASRMAGQHYENEAAAGN